MSQNKAAGKDSGGLGAHVAAHIHDKGQEKYQSQNLAEGGFKTADDKTCYQISH